MAECSKCNGTGRLTWTRNAEGVCFPCKGTGRIEFTASNEDMLNAAANSARYTAEIVLEAAHEGKDERAEHYAILLAGALFRCGTERARAVLAEMVRGDYYHHLTGEALRCPSGRQWAERTIEIGRELKAAAS